MGKREHQSHAGTRGGSQQHRQSSNGADHRGPSQKTHALGDEGGNVPQRTSINRRGHSKNQRDGPSGSQTRAGTANLNSSASQGKHSLGNGAGAGNASVSSIYNAGAKNQKPLSSNVSQGGSSAHQQRSNSKVAYNHNQQDDSQAQMMHSSFKAPSKGQAPSNNKLNRRAGSNQVDISGAGSEYTKMNAKGGHGASQMYQSQQAAGGAHSSAMGQDASSFGAGAYGQGGAQGGMHPSNQSQQHHSMHGQPQHLQSNAMSSSDQQ